MEQDEIEARKAKEAEEKAKKEAERAAKGQARQDAIATKEKTKQDEMEARKAEEAEEKAKKEAERAAKGQARQDAIATKEKVDIYEGNFDIVVQFPRSYEQVRQFAQHLKEIENLEILWIGGSEVEGAIIGISVQKPITLAQILSEIPVVEQVNAMARDITVVLKTPTFD